MALRTRMGSQKPKGSGNTVTLSVWVETGPGTKAEVEISWSPSELGSPSAISPSTGVASAGKVVWEGQYVTPQEQSYSVTLSCASSGGHTVTGEATPTEGSPSSGSTQVSC